MSKFLFRELPEPTREAVAEIIYELEHLVPPWIDQVSVLWNTPDDTNEVAQISVAVSYHHATIRIAPVFVAGYDKEERKTFLIHEIIHIYLERLLDFSKSIIANGDFTSNVRKLLNDQLRDTLEYITEDLNLMVQRVNTARPDTNS